MTGSREPVLKVFFHFLKTPSLPTRLFPVGGDEMKWVVMSPVFPWVPQGVTA